MDFSLGDPPCIYRVSICRSSCVMSVPRIRSVPAGRTSSQPCDFSVNGVSELTGLSIAVSVTGNSVAALAGALRVTADKAGAS